MIEAVAENPYVEENHFIPGISQTSDSPTPIIARQQFDSSRQLNYLQSGSQDSQGTCCIQPLKETPFYLGTNADWTARTLCESSQ